MGEALLIVIRKIIQEKNSWVIRRSQSNTISVTNDE